MADSPTIPSTDYSAEPTPATYPYVGWVPTANGQLSFRHIGESDHPEPTKYANVTTASRRIIVAFQRRKLSDALFKFITHRIAGIEGSFWFGIAAHTPGPANYTQALLGTVYIFKSKDDWRTRGKRGIRDAIDRLNAARLLSAPSHDQRIDDAFIDASNHFDRTADIKLAFHLRRTGEIYFASPMYQDKDLEYASVDYAGQSDHDFAHWVADQSYFFVRDISHTHQHHSPYSDTILTLQEHLADELIWRRNIIYALQHYIIRSKRVLTAASLSQAAGVHGYYMSFRAITRRALGSRASQLPRFNDAPLLQSIGARMQEKLADAAQRGMHDLIKESRVARYVLSGLTVFGIVVAIIIMFVQNHLQDNDKFKAVIDFLVLQFWPIMIAGFMCIPIVWVLGRRDWQTAPGWPRDILEVGQKRRLRFAAALTAIAFAIAYAAVYWGWHSVEQIGGTVRAFYRIVFG